MDRAVQRHRDFHNVNAWGWPRNWSWLGCMKWGFLGGKPGGAGVAGSGRSFSECHAGRAGLHHGG